MPTLNSKAAPESGVDERSDAALDVETDGLVSDALVSDGQESVEADPADGVNAAEAQEPSDDAALMTELAQAMHRAAEERQTRAVEAVERRRAVHVQGIRERGESEAKVAGDQARRDQAAIVEWAAAEADRINSERERRSEARERELAALLDRHDAQIDWEIETIEATVAEHRSDLDAFFKRLAAEADAATIARLAVEMPRLPDLDRVSEGARARNAAAGALTDAGASAAAPPSDEPETIETINEDLPLQSTMVGVMADPGDADAEARSASFDGPSIEAPASSEPDAAAESAAPQHASSGTLLQAIQVLRPVAAWLNHDNGQGDDAG